MKKIFILIAIVMCVVSCGEINGPENPNTPDNSNTGDSIITEEPTKPKYLVERSYSYLDVAEDYKNSYDTNTTFQYVCERDTDPKYQLVCTEYRNGEIMYKQVFKHDGQTEYNYLIFSNGQEMEGSEPNNYVIYHDEARTLMKETGDKIYKTIFEYDSHNRITGSKSYYGEQLLGEEIYTYGEGVRYGQVFNYNISEEPTMQDTCEYYDAMCTQLKTQRSWYINSIQGVTLDICEYEYGTYGETKRVYTCLINGEEVNFTTITTTWTDALNCTRISEVYFSGNYVCKEKIVEKYVMGL